MLFGVIVGSIINWSQERNKNKRLKFKKWAYDYYDDAIKAAAIGLAVIVFDDEIIAWTGSAFIENMGDLLYFFAGLGREGFLYIKDRFLSFNSKK